MAKEKQCRAVTRRGNRCGMTKSIGPTGLCLWHDPDRAVEAQEARIKGGKAAKRVPRRTPKRPLRSLDDAVVWSAWVAEETAKGALDPRAAREITNAIRQFQSGLEKRDLEREVGELKEQLREVRKRRVS